MPSSSNALKAMEAAPSRDAFVDLRTVTHSAVHVDLRTVAQSMGKRYQQELESALVSVESAWANVINTHQTLHVGDRFTRTGNDTRAREGASRQTPKS